MFEQIRDSFAQMQPGDKMVMHLHKAQAKPQYQMPGAAGGAAQPSTMGGSVSSGSTGAAPEGAPSMMPTGTSPVGDPMMGQGGGAMPALEHRDALIAGLSRMRGGM